MLKLILEMDLFYYFCESLDLLLSTHMGVDIIDVGFIFVKAVTCCGIIKVTCFVKAYTCYGIKVNLRCG